MKSADKLALLERIFWDYNIEYLPLTEFVEHQFNEIKEYDYRLIITRMLERSNWYDLLDVLGKDVLIDVLTSDIVDRLRSRELKSRYERIKRILLKETGPFSGYDPQSVRRIKSAVLSDRRYSA